MTRSGWDMDANIACFISRGRELQFLCSFKKKVMDSFGVRTAMRNTAHTEEPFPQDFRAEFTLVSFKNGLIVVRHERRRKKRKKKKEKLLKRRKEKENEQNKAITHSKQINQNDICVIV